MGHFNINEDKLKLSVREKECKRPGQTNITNSAEEKCLTKTLRWKIAKLRMRTEMEEQFYFTPHYFTTTDARSPICAERSTFLVYNI